MSRSLARRALSVLFLLTLLPLSAVRAGTVDPAFRAKLDRRAPREMVSAMVMMADGVDLVTLDNQLIAEKASRRVRHERVVRALQAMSARTQRNVCRFLETQRARGEVESFRPFWVTNAIAVTATRDLIERMARRPDVGVVYEDAVIPLDETYRVRDAATAAGVDPPHISGVEHGVTSLNADSLWRAGITGEGVLVCNLDTGVDGAHPALAGRWRGTDPGVTPQEAWFDPYNHSTFPVDDDGHGTGTMGCMTGVDPATGDSVGVAPGAKWIAANVFESNISSSSAFTGAFEWTIDPDGDPATIEDVPDVINNSWGSSATCGMGYWASIDANIMAGVAVVFSAGNDGPGPQTIDAPANRIATPTNVFSVGATNPQNGIASFSSRGPSVCDGVTIKPEVVAHGTNVRTARRGGGYSGGNAGTSFSGPYVAGGLALLRQANPYATPDQLMEAMMNTAVDLGTPGEDNTYGHGIPDLAAAAADLQGVPRSPRLTVGGTVVDDGNDGVPEAGESFDLIVYIGNFASRATGVEATLSLSEPDTNVSIGTDFAAFGDIGLNQTGNNAAAPYTVTLGAGTPGAHVMKFLLDVTSDGGTYTVPLTFSLRTPFLITMADHDAGNVRFSVSDGGRFGWAQGQLDGSGFVYPIDDRDNLFEGALVAGYDSLHVSHSARQDPSGSELTDWQLVPGGEIVITDPGSFADQDGTSRYADTGADAPMDLEVTQRSYAWAAPPYDDFVIVELTFHNEGLDSTSDIDSLYAGVYMDWDIPPFVQLPLNNAAVDTALDVGYMQNTSTDRHCAVHVLTEPGVTGFDIIDNQAAEYGFTKPEFWRSMSGGIADFTGSSKDFSYVLATGPFHLAAGDSVTAAFAFIGADSHDDLVANIVAAREIYGVPNEIGDSGGTEIALPRAFALGQNYPNPFNPSTTIRYGVPAGTGASVRVALDVFDLRGRKVRTLVDAERAPGEYAVQWDGHGDHGEALASGVYLYRIHAGEFKATRRMMLLK